MYIPDKDDVDDMTAYFNDILASEGLSVHAGRRSKSNKRKIKDVVEDNVEIDPKSRAEKWAEIAERQHMRALGRGPGYVGIEAQQIIETEIRIIRISDVVDIVDEIQEPEERPTFQEARAARREYPAMPEEVIAKKRHEKLMRNQKRRNAKKK